MWRKGPLFEPCSSCVAVDSFFFRKKTISGKKRPSQRIILRSFLTIFVQVPQCQFFGGGRGGDDDVATTTTTMRRRDKSEITWPLTHHTQGPNTSWGTPSLWRIFEICDFCFGRKPVKKASLIRLSSFISTYTCSFVQNGWFSTHIGSNYILGKNGPAIFRNPALETNDVWWLLRPSCQVQKLHLLIL